MTEIRLDTLTIPGADLGPENPLPPLRGGRDVHAGSAAPDVPDEIRQNLDYGHINSILPYTLQDGYTREHHTLSLRTAVLENDVLRATFLLDYGGRLWSLWYKPEQRELLYTSPTFQFANMSLRHAWFAGGVEWNIGMIGHSPHTCAPMFAARVSAPDGTPILRLYEWERLRQVPYQMDFFLPDGSPWLFVRVRIRNPHDRTIPMYWWSNAGVPETPDTRVLVPATSAYFFDYKRSILLRIPTPAYKGNDYTYPTNVFRSADYFFHVPKGQRPWIASVDGAGIGRIQTSTPRLRGRKLFVYGMAPGGRHWPAFIAGPGETYIEIQAGLAHTQLELLPMPAGAEWYWLEAYGPLSADPDTVHGEDWDRAWQHVDALLDAALPPGTLEAQEQRAQTWQDTPPTEMLNMGSGWGALESIRRQRMGEPPFAGPELPFPREALTERQQPWLALLQTGVLPQADPESPPLGFMIQREWKELLEKSVMRPDGDHWFAWLHLGVMRFAADDLTSAHEAWERSLQHVRTPWALRNLAFLAGVQGDHERAARFYEEALALRPDLLPLAVECIRAQIEAYRPEHGLELLETLPEDIRQSGRIRLLEGQAALAAGDLEQVAAILETPFDVPDMQEGEKSLSDLWIDYHLQRISRAEGVPITDELRARVLREYPVPEALDFRMDTEEPEGSYGEDRAAP